jgi:L-alanine-DL-glutamate epimerase-like enolase superfamily enzyme
VRSAFGWYGISRQDPEYFILNEAIQFLKASAFRVPTDSPESDGTLEWKSTTMILVELGVGKISGWGYSYTHECSLRLIQKMLFPIVRGQDPFSVPRLVEEMNAAVRNVGRNGIAAAARAAVETALWDLKARLLGVSLVKLLGAVRRKIPIYGSGGFTSYSEKQLCRQLAGWVHEGISMVKMKIGREPERDARRVRWARKAIGEKAALFVDANGAYSPRQALELAEQFSTRQVTWFEEPVSSDDLAGLRFLQQHAPAKMEIAAGEYNFDLGAARRMVEAGAVDVLQADVTRCGLTVFLQMNALADAFQIPLSAHTAPALHAHLGCLVPRMRHVEYFHDHVRIERMFFDGATVRHKNGFLQPDEAQPGLGLTFKHKDARQFEITP